MNSKEVKKKLTPDEAQAIFNWIRLGIILAFAVFAIIAYIV